MFQMSAGTGRSEAPPKFICSGEGGEEGRRGLYIVKESVWFPYSIEKHLLSIIFLLGGGDKIS